MDRARSVITAALIRWSSTSEPFLQKEPMQCRRCSQSPRTAAIDLRGPFGFKGPKRRHIRARRRQDQRPRFRLVGRNLSCFLFFASRAPQVVVFHTWASALIRPTPVCTYRRPLRETSRPAAGQALRRSKHKKGEATWPRRNSNTNNLCLCYIYFGTPSSSDPPPSCAGGKPLTNVCLPPVRLHLSSPRTSASSLPTRFPQRWVIVLKRHPNAPRATR